jgi:monofunctional biosynthetic peptidoglycan transglycosylase
VAWTAACLLLLVPTAYAGLCVLALMVFRVVDPPLTTVQLQRFVEGLSGDRPGEWRRETVPLERVSIHLQHAVVAAEDARFYEHWGVDVRGLQEAVEDNLRRGRLWRGGSTITQQLVKNLFLTTHATLVRKAFELPLALLAELFLPKRRILELYLNAVEWGPGVFGAEAAARFHYDVSAARLTREQSARLAACLPSPRRRTPQRMDRYGAVILRRMGQMGW